MMKQILRTLLFAFYFTGLFAVSTYTQSPAKNQFFFTSTNPQDLPKYWTVIKVFANEEQIPGIGLRTTALFASDGLTIKAYCLDPGLLIPPIGMTCQLGDSGIFHCGNIFQRFRPIPEQPTPTPPPTPTPKPLTCEDLGLGLHVVYGKQNNVSQKASGVLAFIAHTRDFRLDPLAISPDEIWNKHPIHMVSPNSTCGTFTVFGKTADLPPEVTDIQVSVYCPGLTLDLSSEAADGNYCFGCKDINYSQKMCSVSNKITIESDGQVQVCQAFYLVIDPPVQTRKNGR